MSYSFTDISISNLGLTSSSSAVVPPGLGIPFSLTCNSNVWLSFEGSIVENAEEASTFVVMATMKYYNLLAPAGVTIVSPLKVLVADGKIVTLTPVQLASALAPGTYYAQLLLSTLAGSYNVNITGQFSITFTPTGL